MATPNGQLPDPDQPQAQATLPPQPMQQAPVVQQNAQPQPVQPTPEQATAAHDSMIGRAFKVISGQNTQYQVDPTTGRTIATQSQNTPGQFFKNIVAAALVGGAAGADNANSRTAGSGLASAMKGGTAVIDRDKQLDQERVQRAQQEFQNEQHAAENQRQEAEAQRQAQGFQSQELLRKAQIAQSNVETLRLNTLIHGEDFKQHQDMAAAGQQHFADYKEAGLKPIAQDISESDMHDFVKNRPGASTLDWEPTGTKVDMDAQGNPSYQLTYSAFDPKGKIPVSKGTIDQWKQDGMDKYYPDLFNNLKAGREVDTSQYLAMKRLDTQLYTNNFSRQKQSADLADIKSQVQMRAAEAAKSYAEAAKDKFEISEASLGKKKEDQFNSAMQELNSVGGDISKLKPSSKLIIGESTSKLLPAYNAAIKNAIEAGDQDTAKDLMGQLNNITRATSSIFEKPAGPVAHPEVLSILTGIPGFKPEVAQQFANLSPDQIQEQVSASKLPADVKTKILNAVGKTVAPPKSVWDPNKGQWIRAVAGGVASAAKQAASVATTGSPDVTQ